MAPPQGKGRSALGSFPPQVSQELPLKQPENSPLISMKMRVVWGKQEEIWVQIEAHMPKIKTKTNSTFLLFPILPFNALFLSLSLSPFFRPLLKSHFYPLFPLFLQYPIYALFSLLSPSISTSFSLCIDLFFLPFLSLKP